MTALVDGATGYTTVGDYTDTAPAYPITGSGTTVTALAASFTALTYFPMLAEGIIESSEDFRGNETWGVIS